MDVGYSGVTKISSEKSLQRPRSDCARTATWRSSPGTHVEITACDSLVAVSRDRISFGLRDHTSYCTTSDSESSSASVTSSQSSSTIDSGVPKSTHRDVFDATISPSGGFGFSGEGPAVAGNDEPEPEISPDDTPDKSLSLSLVLFLPIRSPTTARTVAGPSSSVTTSPMTRRWSFAPRESAVT